MGNKQTKKEVNITEYIYGVAIFIMLFIMVLGPILWVLGYGGNKWHRKKKQKKFIVNTQMLLI